LGAEYFGEDCVDHIFAFSPSLTVVRRYGVEVWEVWEVQQVDEVEEEVEVPDDQEVWLRWCEFGISG
jgi:hypothetical protein